MVLSVTVKNWVLIIVIMILKQDVTELVSDDQLKGYTVDRGQVREFYRIFNFAFTFNILSAFVSSVAFMSTHALLQFDLDESDPAAIKPRIQPVYQLVHCLGVFLFLAYLFALANVINSELEPKTDALTFEVCIGLIILGCIHAICIAYNLIIFFDWHFLLMKLPHGK